MRNVLNVILVGLLFIVTVILLATFAGGFFLTTLGVAEGINYDPLKGVFTTLVGILWMSAACWVMHKLHLVEWSRMQFHLLWRWLRQQSRIDALERDVEDLDSRLRSALDEAFARWEDGAELQRDYNVLEAQHIRLQEQHHLLLQEMENLNEDFKDASDQLAFKRTETYWFLRSIQSLREENDQLRKQMALLRLVEWADKTHAALARK